MAKKALQEYKKVMARSFPLFFYESWYIGERFELPKLCDEKMFFDPLFVYKKGAGTDVYYNFTDKMQFPMALVLYFKKNINKLKGITSEQRKNYLKLKDVSNNKKLSHVEKLKQLFDLTLDMHPVLTTMIVIANNAESNDNIVKISHRARTATEDFVFKSIEPMLDCIKKIIPSEYKKYSYFLTYSEVMGKLPPLKVLQDRSKEFVYYQGKVYVDVNINKFAKKHNLNIVIEKINYSSKNLVVKGNIANPGKIKGIVKKVFEVADMKKIKKGNILVTSMTTPDLVSVSKDFVAIVTDEGGITCHAAIISREMNIPAIIGTKNATQVLKDGDLVEVDANKGIVKILKRA